MRGEGSSQVTCPFCLMRAFHLPYRRLTPRNPDVTGRPPISHTAASPDTVTSGLLAPAYYSTT